MLGPRESFAWCVECVCMVSVRCRCLVLAGRASRLPARPATGTTRMGCLHAAPPHRLQPGSSGAPTGYQAGYESGRGLALRGIGSQWPSWTDRWVLTFLSLDFLDTQGSKIFHNYKINSLWTMSAHLCTALEFDFKNTWNGIDITWHNLRAY